MATYNISINDELDQIVKSEMHKKKYANRSEFFRSLIRKAYISDNNIITKLDKKDPDYNIAIEKYTHGSFSSLEEAKKALDV
jgi:Arc/MetJ-type ribon-helix-helix transcriptional regulator